MAKYQPPSFQNRVRAAAEAKQKALERLRSRKAPAGDLDPTKAAAKAAKAAEASKKREMKRADWERQKAERRIRADERRRLEAIFSVETTDRELDAARKSRYSPRKKPI